MDPWLRGGGPSRHVRESIEATAALLFSEPVPAGELNVDDSMSYADWLRSSAVGFDSLRRISHGLRRLFSLPELLISC